MMLRKKVCICGLYLINTAIIAASTLNATIAKENSQVINSLLQANWRIYAYNIIEESQSELRERFQFSHQDIQTYEFKPWFIDEYYDESIKQVIGKAIADCVTNMNEFKDKKDGELITFDGLEYEDRPEDYTQENWNAVVLYNYVARQFECYKEAHPAHQQKGFTFTKRWKEIKEYIGQPIKDHYEKYFKKNNLVDKIAGMKNAIDDAIREIDLYEKALDLSQFMVGLNLFSIGSDGILKFPGTIEGKTREAALLWHPISPGFCDTVSYVRRENRNGMMDEMIYSTDLQPKFYLYEGVYYIAGYYGWDYCLEYEYKKTTKLKHMTEGKEIDRTLIPISRKEEDELTKNEEQLKQNDRTTYFKKQKKLYDNLNNIFTPIFGDLVKVSPLYCD